MMTQYLGIGHDSLAVFFIFRHCRIVGGCNSLFGVIPIAILVYPRLCRSIVVCLFRLFCAELRGVDIVRSELKVF